MIYMFKNYLKKKKKTGFFFFLLFHENYEKNEKTTEGNADRENNYLLTKEYKIVDAENLI